MSPTRSLCSVILCIFLLIPIVSSEHQSLRIDSFRRALFQQTGYDYNGSGQENANSSDQNHTPQRAPPSFAHEFLHAHNEVRMNLKQPLFKWDKKLARYARRWGIKRAADCKMIHSYGPYGENLFWGGRDHWTPTEAVESWAREQYYYDAEKNACSEGQMCGHYTQIVWRDSLNLGCARIKCLTGGVLVICEYDPPGNYVDESPFGTTNGRGGAAGTPLDSTQTIPSTTNPPPPVEPGTTTA